MEEKKNKGGRPSKYHERFVQEMAEYTKSNFEKDRLPILEEFAYLIDIDGDTIVEWGKKHPRFSAAINKLKTAQSQMLQRGIYDGSGNPTGGSFLLVNNHGFKNKTENYNKNEATPVPIINVNVHPNNSNAKNK